MSKYPYSSKTDYSSNISQIKIDYPGIKVLMLSSKHIPRSEMRSETDFKWTEVEILNPKNTQFWHFTYILQPKLSPLFIASARSQRIQKVQPLRYTTRTFDFPISLVVFELQPKTLNPNNRDFLDLTGEIPKIPTARCISFQKLFITENGLCDVYN